MIPTHLCFHTLRNGFSIFNRSADFSSVFLLLNLQWVSKSVALSITTKQGRKKGRKTIEERSTIGSRPHKDTTLMNEVRAELPIKINSSKTC